MVDVIPRKGGLTGPERVGILEGLHRDVYLLGVGIVEPYTGLKVVTELVGSVDTTLELLVIDTVEGTVVLVV